MTLDCAISLDANVFFRYGPAANSNRRDRGMRMFLAIVMIGVSALALPARAQPTCYGFFDATSAALSASLGCDFTRSGVYRPGAIGGANHPYNFGRGWDVELYGVLTWNGPSGWLVIGNLGAGYTERAEDWAFSVRGVLAVTATWRVAPFVMVYLAHTPAQNGQPSDTLLQAKVGAAVSLDNVLRLIGYLGTTASLRGGWFSGPGGYVSPGASLIWSF